jgi:hypothetical protein
MAMAEPVGADDEREVTITTTITTTRTTTIRDHVPRSRSAITYRDHDPRSRTAIT